MVVQLIRAENSYKEEVGERTVGAANEEKRRLAST